MSSTKNQYWMKIFALTFFLGLSLSEFFISLTWTWGNNWGNISDHIDYLLRDGWMKLPLNISDYKAYLEDGELGGHFALHLILPTLIAFVISYTFSFLILYEPSSRGRNQKLIAGPVLTHGQKEAKKLARKQLKAELRKDSMGSGVNLHPAVAITRRCELGNLLIYGMQGAGKSVIVKPLVSGVIDRGDKVLIYDAKREYTPLFLDSRASLLSPSDRRSLVWNPSLDVRDEEGAHLLAACLISEEGKEIFWTQGARLILAGCIIYLMRTKSSWGWKELDNALSLKESELKEVLSKYSPPASKLIDAQSKTTHGFMTILASQLSWLGRLAMTWPNSHLSKFSASTWLRTRNTSKQVLIISNDPLQHRITEALLNAFLSLTTQNLLARDDSDSFAIWFFLDELGSLPKLQSLERILTTCRSKGARTVVGIQNISQLRSKYGQQDAETILSLFSNVISLRLGSSGDSASVASKSLGERLVEVPTKTIDQHGNTTTTFQQNNEQVVTARDIVQLPPADNGFVTGYLTIAGRNAIYYLNWPLNTMPVLAPPHEPLSSESVRVNHPKKRKIIGSRGRAAS